MLRAQGLKGNCSINGLLSPHVVGNQESRPGVWATGFPARVQGSDLS